MSSRTGEPSQSAEDGVSPQSLQGRSEASLSSRDGVSP
jgi:hypothetical protein